MRLVKFWNSILIREKERKKESGFVTTAVWDPTLIVFSHKDTRRSF